MQTLRILSLESKLYGQFSYIPNSSSGVISFFFFFSLRNFQKISPKMKFPVLCFLRVGQGVAAVRGPQAWGGTFCGMTVERGSQVGLCCPLLSMILHGFTRPFTGSSEVHRTIQVLTRCPCCTAGCLGPLGIQSHHTRQLRTAINILTQD